MSTTRTWLQLLRAPNLFTVPGDALAGYFLANSGAFDRSLAFITLVSLCFYGAGLLQNDCADEAEDLRERPNRPLPSGAARRSAVLAVALGLAAAGLGLAAFAGGKNGLLVGALIIGAVSIYNLLTKRWVIVGALNMGACRGLSMLLGGTAGPNASFGWMLAFLPAIMLTLYVAAVTNLARHETRAKVPIIARCLPVVVMLLIGVGGVQYALQSPGTKPAAVLFLIAAGLVAIYAVQMVRRRAPLPPFIGAHLRVLLILQAAFCWLGDSQSDIELGNGLRLWSGGRLAACFLLACWPLSRLVARRFYAS